MPRQKKQHLKRRKDGRYACRYLDQWFYGATEEEALALREEYKRQESRGTPYASTCSTLAEYAQKWLPIAKPNVRASTYNESVGLMEKLLHVCGGKLLRDVLASDIKSVYSIQFNGLSDSYIRSAKQLYTGLFDAAVADGLIQRNPAKEKSAQPHRGTRGGHRAITEQERKWIDTLCLNHRARPAVMAMLYEGLRPPEAKALDISKSVDREARMIHLVEFAHRGERGVYEITGEGKNKRSRRDVPLFTPFENAIKGMDGKLVTTVNGGELTERAWRCMWLSYVHQMETEINGLEKRWYKRTKEHKKILAEAEQLRKDGKKEEAKAKEAEIPPWVPFTVRPYDLRHSFCTYGRDLDPPIEVHTMIQWMGHSDASMIMKIYDEVSTDRSKKEAERLEKSLNRSQNGSQKKVFRVKRSKIKGFRP